MSASAVTTRARTVIIAAVFAAVSLLYHFKLLERFELVTYDYRVILRGDRMADPRIVVIEIADDSIERIGRWPWTRDWHAAMIKVLNSMGAKAVAFDVLFSEPDNTEKDGYLAQAVAETGNVYLAQLHVPASDHNDEKMISSLPEIRKSAKGQGHINLTPDIDGVMRRMKLTTPFGDQNVPQLSLAMALDQYGAKLEDLSVSQSEAVIRTPDGPIRIPLDHQGNMLINWVGRWKTAFDHYSYSEVLSSFAKIQKGERSKIPPNAFKDRLCYIGNTASGLFDIRPTPLEPLYPAVGVNLTLLDNLLQKQFIRVASGWENLLILIFLALALFKITEFSSFFKKAMWTAGTLAGYALASIVIFIYSGYYINMIYSMLLIVAIYFLVTAYNEIVITVERGKLLRMATRDSMTGLHNVAHFKLLLGAEISTLPLRTTKKISIVMCDVDHFKHTNDTYGHVTGDAVLREVAQVLKSTCRALDIVGRYGGEEFIMMLVGANAEEAFKVAEKCRIAISEKVFPHPTGDFKKTISMGITALNPEDAKKSIDEIVARADRALYEAKTSGRNRVVIAKDSPVIPTA